MVALTTVTSVAAVVPKSTAVAPVNPVPVIVTGVPPAAGPLFGLTPVTVGAADSGGVREPIGGRGGRRPGRSDYGHVHGAGARWAVGRDRGVVDHGRRPSPAVVPKSTAVAPVNPVPVIVTEVPPAAGPLSGLMPVTVGAGATAWVSTTSLPSPPS